MFLKYFSLSIINLFVGICIGLLISYLKNKRISKINQSSDFFINNEIKLHNYKNILTYHFSHTAELLSKISEEYKNLYKHMSESSKDLLFNDNENNESLFKNSIHKDSLIKMPRDYSDDS
ncbi:YhcB family protein [Candidatus Purcelliella pentastirinorum]|uniref:Z-ring associated protein G n=1 Tax=Candidatus Purcelliella pentastirinorum TaxID=472834 RepID=A0A346DZ31_9ENTR|nr:DUF1043 family protein [Candidatus Purcelliella pentastirinorum]AXN01986.1 Putative cytochrome d ubiquinol oxidase subunit III [Candidatus Purcelliella pentastirinorum]WDI78955.1 YhcB family protein [Candidatus Purcelliella pentastirinorum]WDR80091.1 YhcB family protein [Candidatus Purcelliella pentastirinorum]